MKVRAAVLREIGRPGPYAETRPLGIEEVELDPPGKGEVLVMTRPTKTPVFKAPGVGVSPAQLVAVLPIKVPLVRCKDLPVPSGVNGHGERSRYSVLSTFTWVATAAMVAG